MTQSMVAEGREQSVQVEELKAFISKQRDGRQVKKALAVKLLYQGHTYESVVHILTYESKQSYYDLFEAAGLSWKKTSKVNPKAGAEAVAAKKPTSSGCWHATARR